MAHFIIFERTFGHCVTQFIKAATLHEALVKYAQKVMDCEVQEDGTIICGNHRYIHPIELIEATQKWNAQYDELQWDHKKNKLLNGNCWEIRSVVQEAWDADCAEVFCSAQPWSIGEYITLCRSVLRKKVPRSRARAFVWYLNDGPLVTFYRGKFDSGPLDIMGRYFIPWQRQYWPKSYQLAVDMVEEWHGTLDDVISQMHIDFPF